MEVSWNIYTLLMIVVFALGYFFITIEHVTKMNKTTIALLMGILCWVLQFANEYANYGAVDQESYLSHHIASVSQVVFFLLGALTIVELISAHQGFNIISKNIKATSYKSLLWLLGIVSFFLSAVLDNLTTTIVMITLLQKLIKDRDTRLIMGGAIVIAANAGGAWTPIGDVTTTMLWISGQLTSGAIMKSLFFPSLVCFIASFLWISTKLKGQLTPNQQNKTLPLEPNGTLIFGLGIAALVFVPIFKGLTGLPPFMGILLGLAVLWLITDLLHSQKPDRHHLRMEHAFTRIDMTGVLFFFGILLCIDALESAGILKALAVWLDQKIGNTYVIATLIGIASAVVDNVPLVAATMGMYSMEMYPQDSSFWQLIAFCAGTGGSMLIIGSAAGVVFMGLEKVDFFWYVKNMTLAAMIGYFAGIAVYIIS